MVCVVLYSISNNRLYCCDLCIIYLPYVLITLLCLILLRFVVTKVFKMINCKGFSAGCKAVVLLPLRYKYPEMCSYASIVM